MQENFISLMNHGKSITNKLPYNRYYHVTVGDDADVRRNHICEYKSSMNDVVHVWHCDVRGRYVGAYKNAERWTSPLGILTLREIEAESKHLR